ncbi:MAG: VCBS repeat-containing protein [Lentisphaeria bacterium]|nr:VCBS repeat-containing protein [Lentisphaeria bacterium]
MSDRNRQKQHDAGPRPESRGFLALACCLFALWLSLSVLAVDKSGVTPNTVSLPKGPGSIEGLGEAFAPLLGDGTGKYAVALRLPPGTAGHTPSVVLRYDGANGNGPLGIGWTLDVPFVQRRTQKGIPRYVDAPNGVDDDSDGNIDETDEIDVFVDSDAEELVPVANPDGIHTDYFRRHESTFSRYRRTGEAWEGRLPDGTLLAFGTSAAGRVTDASGSRVFRWLLERSTDRNGNTIVFQYHSVPDTRNTNQVYLSEIRYGPGPPTAGTTWPGFHFVRFTYEPRADWFEDCRPGFPVRTGQRLRLITVGTQGADLSEHGHAAGDFNGDGQGDFLDRAYELAYDADADWSLLTSVTPVGCDNASTLPPVTFAYTAARWAASVSAAGEVIGSAGEPVQVMDLPWVDLLDFNGDGLPDILWTDPYGGPHTVYFNKGEATDGEARALHWSAGVQASGDAQAWNVNLAAEHGAVAHLADMNADGLSDLVFSSGVETYYFPCAPSSSAPSWQARRRMSLTDDGSAPPSPFAVANVKTADVDFDRRIDIIQSISVANGARYRVWYNLDGQRYTRGVTVAPVQGFMLSDTGVHIADMNGDRVPDITRIRASELWVTAGTGYGRFQPVETVDIPDWTLDAEHLAQAALEDITGDGLADLVVDRPAPGQLWVWVNRGNYTLGTRCVVTGLPAQFGLQPERRWADLNGNGTVDLVYADGAALPRIQAVDLGRLLGCVPTPHLLIGIDNGIGRRITIRYTTTTEAALADAAAGSPWPDPLPFPVDVVAGVTVDDTRGNRTTTDFGYHEGYYDPLEHTFCGFARVVQTDRGDEAAPTLMSRFLFHTGKGDLAMKGNVLAVSVEQEDGAAFHGENTSWHTRLLHTGLDGRQVRFAHRTSQVRDISERGHGTPRRVETEYEYDDYGNETAVRELGVTETGNPGACADERITLTEYACNLESWFLRFPARTTVRDLAGTIVSREETYYDDPTFGGANLGAVTMGAPTLVRRWTDPADEGASVDAARTCYDGYGNPIALLDPLALAPGGIPDAAAGHYRTVAYDGVFHAYPVSETVHLEAGSDDLVLTAAYDEGLGTVVCATEPNGHVTTYGHDAFGRLVHILRPGDDPGYPSIEYEYVLGHALGLKERATSPKQGDPPPGPFAGPFRAAVPTVNWIETRRLDREADTAGLRREHYQISRIFVDGLGRELMTRTEAEESPGTGLPRVAVQGTVRFGARGQAAVVLNPFYTLTGGDLDAQLGFEDITAPGWQGLFHVEGVDLPLDLAEAHRTTTIYDATLRPLRRTNPDGSATEMTYEPLGVSTADENDSDPASPYHGTPTVHWSDGLGRLIRVGQAVRLQDDGTPSPALQTWMTSYQYRADGVLRLLTDSQSNQKSFEYDGLGRRILLRDPDRGVLTSVYDAASNLTQTTDAKGQTVAYAYDGANRLLSETYSAPSGGSPKAGAKAPDVLYHYDVPAGVIDFGNGDAGAAGNTKGRLAWVEDLSGEEHTSYDARGREAWVVKRIPDPIHGALLSYRTASAHDAMDRLVELVYPDGDRCTYEYNRRGLLERIAGGATANAAGTPWIVREAAYTPSGQPLSTSYGNGVSTGHAYDARLRLTRLRSMPSATGHGVPVSPLIDYAYSFDGASNITRIDDLRPGEARPEGDPRRNTQVFQYDDLYRLTQVRYSFALPGQPDRSDGHIAYRYDRIGNMLAKTSDIVHADPGTGLSVTNLGTMSYGGAAGAWGRTAEDGKGTKPATPPAPGPHALTHCDAEDRGYAYDGNGNMLSIDGLACTWDVLDRLAAVENDRMRAEYAYDYTGRRIWKKVWEKDGAGATGSSPSSATVYVGRHFEVREYDQPTKVVFAGETRVARISGSLDETAPRVQRFRVFPGWNLLTLAVSLPAAGPLFPAAAAAFLWDPVSGGYLPVDAGDALPAGAVLWVYGEAAATLVLAGTYSEPGVFPVPAGGSFVSGPPLAAWHADSALPALSRAWRFDPVTQQWQVKVPAELSFLSGFPAFIAPGEPVFIASSGPSILDTRPALSIRYYHQDHLGSSAVIADAAGNVVDETVSYPFGYPRRHDRPEAARSVLPARYGFTQKEQDEETGLHYFEARYLVAALGRFASVDPLSEVVPAAMLTDPQRLHAYAYAHGNPLRIIDPSGQWGAFTGAGAGIGAAAGFLGHTIKFIASEKYRAKCRSWRGKEEHHGNVLGFLKGAAKSTVLGAVSGAIAGAVIDTAGGVALAGWALFGASTGAGAFGGLAGGAIAEGGEVVSEKLRGADIKGWGRRIGKAAGIGTLLGALFGGVGGGIGAAVNMPTVAAYTTEGAIVAAEETAPSIWKWARNRSRNAETTNGLDLSSLTPEQNEILAGEFWLEPSRGHERRHDVE